MAEATSDGPSNTPVAAPAAAVTPAPAENLLTPKAPEAAAAPAETPTVDAKTADEGKTAPEAEAPAAPVVPEKYEFKTPEDIVLDTKVVDAYVPAFKKLGLTQEQAQELVDLNIKQFQDGQKAYQDQLVQQQRQWLEDSKAQFAQHELDAAQSAIAAFGGKDFVSLLEQIGIQNHPTVVRFARNVGIRLSEDRFEGDTTPSPRDTRDAASKLYPSHTKQ